MSKAFFSHSSKQKWLVEALVKRIGRDNAVVDKYNFEVGFPTLDEILKGIEKTDLFILFLSNDALNSNWVQNEIRIAKNFKDQDISSSLLMLNVDSELSHSDTRIPSWLSEQFNLRPITDPILIYKKITSRSRDLVILNHPFIAKKEEIYIGRNDVWNGKLPPKQYDLKVDKLFNFKTVKR